MELTSADHPVREVDLNYISCTASYTYFTSFLNKLLILNGSLIVDGSQKNFEQLKPMASATLAFKSSEDVNMSIGLIGIIDPTAKNSCIPNLNLCSQS